jgi:Protein of unknown function (DUF2778)
MRLLGAAALVRTGGPLDYVGVRAVSAGIAAVGMGFALGFLGTYGIGSANAGLGSVLARISVFGTVDPRSSELLQPLAAQAPGMQLASLETTFVSVAADEDSEPPVPVQRRGSFIERFFADQSLDSFDDRFAGVAVSPVRATVKTAELQDGADSLRLTPPDAGGRAIALPAVARSASKLAAAVTPSPLASPAKKRVHTADLSKDWTSPPDPDSHTAIYDIVAHVVYLPNGKRLEAHSGLGSNMDDPRYISAKGRGPTPNVYDLTLREELFHGARAIRLNPVDDGKMFGRDGILAHTYMLGPNGQSNGCVSFSDYQAFLNAYLNGEINRIVVVEHLANGPGPDGSGWFAEVFKGLFGRT